MNNAKKSLVPHRRFKEFQNAGAWEQRKLEDISIINPKSVIPEHFKYVDLESVVGTDLISFIETDKNSAPSRAQRVARTGDIFYQTVRPYQKNNYLFTLKDKDYVFSTGYAQIRSDVDNAFLMSYLQNENFVQTVLRHSTGTSYPAISPSDLAKISVFIPKKQKEQLKIGKAFSNIDNLITLHQRKLNKLKKLKSAYLTEMFPDEGEHKPKRRFAGFTDDWEQRKLGDTVNSIVAGGDIDKSKIQENGKYPVYANALTNDGVIGYYNDQYRVKAPAVTVTGRGEIGVAKTRNTNFTPVVRLLAINSMHNNYFLENLINTHRAFAESTGVPQLTAPQLANYKLKFPKSIEEESKIGNFFNNLDSLITLHQRKIDKLQKLKNAYLNEMFV